MRKEKINDWLERVFRGMVYGWPAVLFFSYEPVIALGKSESMNFELSLPLVWLVVFDMVVVALMWRRKMLFRGLKKKWVWLLLPIWLSLSVLWSLNVIRGILTVGILWLLYLAVDGLVSLKGLFEGVGVRERFWKMFLGASLVACAWCWLQCVLDLVGLERGYTLMCAGCTYHMFGFPHPDGFAIEPQFMGNLLLAPTIAAGWMVIYKKNRSDIFWTRVQNPCRHRGFGANSRLARLRNVLKISLLVPFAILSATLFLTFSRGTIYAFVVGMVVMSGWSIASAKKRSESMKRVGLVWGLIVVAFVMALNVQGLMAELSPTNDTYKTGVAKVLNHLTLGIVDIREETGVNNGSAEESVVTEKGELDDEDSTNDREDAVENSVENFEEGIAEEAVFDGYVAESTDARLRLTRSAVEIWKHDAVTMLFGVGLGGAGQALYANGLSPAPKEIVQNQYASLLLETGIVGVSLLVLTLVLVIRVVLKSRNKIMVLSLMMAYGVSLCFFSGLPNALHIYLMPVLLLL